MPKKILIINTGGTLSSVKSSKGLVPGMRSDDMLEELMDRFGEPPRSVWCPEIWNWKQKISVLWTVRI